MRKTITISLPRELCAELDRVSKREKVTRSEVVRDSLKDHLWLRRFHALRRKMVPHAQAMGIFTDEDVFNIVS